MKTAQVISKKKGRMELPNDFVPGRYSVLCGRGAACTKSPGNRHLKSLVTKYLKPYSEAQTKIEKSSIVSNIIRAVRRVAPEGSFIKMEKGRWVSVDDAFARESEY